MTDQRTRRTADAYSAQAERFDEQWVPILRPIAEPIVAELVGPGARLVLDVGTGSGGMLPVLRSAAPGARIVGLDVSEGMLVIARARGHADSLALCDSQSLPLCGAVADAVLFSFVLHRVLRPELALAEARRVARRGGNVGTVTWGPGVRSAVSAIWRDELADYPEPSESFGVENHGLVDSPDKMAALMAAAGLTVVAARAVRLARPRTVEEAIVESDAPTVRLAGRPAAERAAVIARVSCRLAALSPDELAYRAEAVYAIGRRPA